MTNAWLWRLRLPISKCVWGFPHQAKSLQCQLGVPQFNSILPLSSQRKCLPRDPIGYGLSPTRLSLSPFRWQSPSQVITCASDQPATDQRCQWPLSLGSSRPQGNTSLHLQLMKGHRGTAWWRKVLSCVQEALLPWSLGASSSPRGCVCPLEVLPTPQRLHYIGMIKHLTPFSDFLPSQKKCVLWGRGEGVCWKFQASNHCLAFLVTSSHPRTIQESTQSCLVRKRHSYHTGNYKFQESCGGTEVKDQY